MTRYLPYMVLAFGLAAIFPSYFLYKEDGNIYFLLASISFCISVLLYTRIPRGTD